MSPKKTHIHVRLLRGAGMLAFWIAASHLLFPAQSFANPKGERVIAGKAQFDRNGNTLNITTSNNVIINWDQFNIGANETTRFIQPRSSSMALNRILDSNPSQIFGSLQANGNVFLLNANGILFGPNARVNVNGLVATSLPISDQDFLKGKLHFAGYDTNGAVKNFGNIETAAGGFAYLLAPNVENSGVIRSPDGHIVLAAGTTAYLSNRPDGKGFLVEVKAPAGQAINLRDLVADGGRVGIYGRAVNQSGLVQANTVRDHNGEIELVASERAYLESGSQTVAKGADTGVSQGGSVKVISGGGSKATNPSSDVIMKSGATIDVSGGKKGGDAGEAEVSSAGGLVLEGQVKGDAAPGYKRGGLKIDPANVTITSFGSSNGSPVVDPPGTGTWAFDSPALPANLVLNTFTSFNGLSVVDVEATNNISIAASTDWTPDLTSLTLRAGNNITFGRNASIVGGTNPLQLNLIAGANFQGQSLLDVISGVGNILNPNVQIGQGSITGVAGNSIRVGTGAIGTTGGGSISLTAAGGDINAGNNPAWLAPSPGFNPHLTFDTTGVGSILTQVGGIATQAGGDITLEAPNGTISSDVAHIGAYSLNRLNGQVQGTGNVTMSARDFTGEFFVNNGEAHVNLTGSFGLGARTTTIDLANGSKATVDAADIHLGQIRNPQGVLLPTHIFNYGDPSVTLEANPGDVVLAGDVSAGNPDTAFNVDRILAPNLTVNADQGNIYINNNFVLFPSPTGNLVLNAFGNITNSLPILTFVPTDSVPPDPADPPFETAPFFGDNDFPGIIVSDADPLRQNPKPVNLQTTNYFLYYAKAHGTPPSDQPWSPIHTGDTTPIQITTTIGDVSRLQFGFPKFSIWDIGGNLGAIAFVGQNLSPTPAAPPTGAPQYTVDDLPPGVTQMTVHGNLDWSQKIVYVDGRPTLVNANATDPFYKKIEVDGPGWLDIFVNGFVDLGDSQGILTEGRLNNRYLYDPTPGDGFQSDLTDDGAAINMIVGVDRSGSGGKGTHLKTAKGSAKQDFSLVNSRVATLEGGNININVKNGSLIVGQGTLGTTGSLLARGIYTATGGNINLVAENSVNVLTSRVGAFNGGNVDITAMRGVINAGEGKLTQPSDVPTIGTGGVAFQISGTGIITSTIPCNPPCIQPKVPARPGRITLNAPNIITGSAGITCKGSGCIVNIIGILNLGPGGITSGGSVNITGSVTGAGSISGETVNISGPTSAGANISASAGSGAVTAAASSTSVTTETSQVMKVASSAEGGVSSTGEGDDTSKKKRRKRYIRRGVIIEVTGRPAA